LFHNAVLNFISGDFETKVSWTVARYVDLMRIHRYIIISMKCNYKSVTYKEATVTGVASGW
jgi:hypothetical protein